LGCSMRIGCATTEEKRVNLGGDALGWTTEKGPAHPKTPSHTPTKPPRPNPPSSAYLSKEIIESLITKRDR